ncbi:MAG: hypothetical protein JWO69_515, partial [Thermoleophilia bacterium]|nr:hypothetical protein [Thermoleophilia bacterium]
MTIVRATFLAALLSCTFLVMASPASAAPVVVGPPGNAAANLQLDSDAAGDVHMVWHGQDGARARVAYASVSAAGAVSAPVYLSPAGQDSYDGRVAVAEDG